MIIHFVESDVHVLKEQAQSLGTFLSIWNEIVSLMSHFDNDVWYWNNFDLEQV